MSKRKNQQVEDSHRWPRLFSNPEQAADLMRHPAWLQLVQDCRDKASSATENILAVTTTREKESMSNALKGRVSVWRDITELADELQEWKENKK